ncbi:DUF2281 domain-containing protein [Thiomicrospira microaerophila]|uniref:DUF2281 domain-containing protein n=1 Tax=Thiomicrospira microaerophila TaxID=406020 RepID=UPI00200F4BD1|nr:DUF2281 domain-containing protein [Thiomicrospira microaerophila]
MQVAIQFSDLAAKIERLPLEQRQEVFDFVSFLEARYVSSVSQFSGWGDDDFKSMSVEQAMSGLGDEPDLYSDADLKEHWR